MPPMPYPMSIGPVFSLLNDYLEEGAYMVDMLRELRDPTVRRLSDMEFFKGRELPPRPDGTTAVEHIETDWFGWEPTTGVQDAFSRKNPVKTGWWTAWYGNADQITRETLMRALEVALGVPHNSEEVTPSRQWQLMVNWTCGAPTFQGWVMWQSVKRDPTKGFVVCTFSTPGNGNSLYATPHHPGTPSGKGYQDPAVTVGNRGMWVIGDQCTEMRLRGSDDWLPVTGELPDWTNAFVYTHEQPDPNQPGSFIPGLAVVSPAEEDGGVRPTGAAS